MEQLPNWLTAAVIAAGMTAYADDLYPKVVAAKAPAVEPQQESAPPLH